MGLAKLHLEKWFMDFVNDDGQVMIFYAARMTFMSIGVHYSSWIQCHPDKGLSERSYFRKVDLPKKEGDLISWKNEEFNISGEWRSISQAITARVFEDDDGYLDWNCFQPASKVKLKIQDQIMEGYGYAEQLILTTFPWHIPMDHLRWGRFYSKQNTMVWIELRKEKKEQWLWLNGERVLNSIIEDDLIESADPEFKLILDRKVVLESEKKIFNVVTKLLRFLPGFNKMMTAKFLMATNIKWLSQGEFYKNGSLISNGQAIHEWVNFSGSET